MRATVPLWLEDPGYAPRPALREDAAADVCVVGGGIGGIAAAWHLLERGTRPLVLEARTVGAGATGRNGGFFIAGAAPMYDVTVRRWGRELARRRYAATLDAQRAMLAAADAAGAREHFRVRGLLRLDGEDAIRSHHAALAADGFPGELVEADALPPAVRRPGRIGLLTPHDGGVHPVRWLRALAGAAQARGARICENTPVTAVLGGGVRTATGAKVRADRVVVAMDGGLAALVPATAHVRPRRLNMLATAPGAGRVLPFPVYVRDGHEYAQQLADGRITLGGFSDLDGADSWTDDEEHVSAPVQARLEAWLREELGVAPAVTHRWVGVVGYAPDAVPTCGTVPGTDGRVLAIGGYNGTGHVQAFVAARIVADLATGAPPPDADLYRAPA